MRDAPRIITVEQEGLVCKAMAPECTIPIRTGRRATTRKARKFPRAVAISQRRLGPWLGPSRSWVYVSEAEGPTWLAHRHIRGIRIHSLPHAWGLGHMKTGRTG